jgi:succinoglycan biosynthesis transport protein ExoP
MTLQKPLTAPPLTQSSAYGSAEEADHFERAVKPGIDLVVLLRILRIRKEIIFGTAFAVIALTLIIIFQLTPLYSATSVVMLDQRRNSVEDVSAVLSGMPTDQAGVQNQVQILTSRELAGHVIDKLNLKDDPDYSAELRSWSNYLKFLSPFSWFGGKTRSDASEAEEQRNKFIDHFEKRVTVTPIGLSTAIKVTYEAPDAGDAARIANAIADAYVEDQLNAKFEAAQKATGWLADRIQELSKQAQTAQSAVQQYRAANNLTETATGGSVVDEQMSAISGQLVVARSDLAEKQATYEHVAALQKQGRAADITQVVSSELIGTLRGQEADLARQEADLSSKYGPRNPKMLDIQSQKANLEAKIGEEIDRIVQSVQNEVQIAQAHVASLEGSLSHIEGQSGQQNQLKVKLSALESSAASAKSMYEAFLSKLNQTQDQQGIQTPDARIISRAEVPLYASYPNKLLAMGVAVPAGFLLGLMFAFMMERLDSGFRTSYQVESLLGLPVLATIPEIMPKDNKANEKGSKVLNTQHGAADRVIDRPMSSFSEAIRGLQLAITLSNVDVKPKVIAVTSSVPGEGKTTLAVSLARLSARSGLKTVIVDGDLRRPMVATTMGFSEKPTAGVVEAVLGTLSLDQCFLKDTRSDALILPCAQKPVSPSDFLSSHAFANLMENLKKAFDVVIIDSAPVLPVNDTKILGQLVDTMLFVVRWEKTAREGVSNAIRALHDVHAPVAGIALTRADMARFQYYSYGYQDYYYYNKYYHE